MGGKASRNSGQLCACGCGEFTARASRRDPPRGLKYGDPNKYVHGHGQRENFLLKYIEADRGYSTPCWEWTGGTNDHGYGRASVRTNGATKAKLVQAHRAFYEHHVGDIPDGLEIDHLCRNTICVNPEHLEPVTREENERRKPKNKLSLKQVEEIRELKKQFLSDNPLTEAGKIRIRVSPGFRKDIAFRYGITADYVKQIWNGTR